MTIQLDLNLDLELKFNSYSPEISKILKMCLCVLPLVFIDTSSENDEASSLASNDSKFLHTPMDYITVAAVNMLWCEILNFDGKFDEDSKESNMAERREY